MNESENVEDPIAMWQLGEWATAARNGDRSSRQFIRMPIRTTKDGLSWFSQCQPRSSREIAHRGDPLLDLGSPIVINGSRPPDVPSVGDLGYRDCGHRALAASKQARLSLDRRPEADSVERLLTSKVPRPMAVVPKARTASVRIQSSPGDF